MPQQSLVLVLLGLAVLVGSIVCCLSPYRGYWNRHKRGSRVRSTRLGRGLFCLSLAWTGVTFVLIGLPILSPTILGWSMIPAGLLFLAAAAVDYRAA